jgi:hypothetical protein
MPTYYRDGRETLTDGGPVFETLDTLETVRHHLGEMIGALMTEHERLSQAIDACLASTETRPVVTVADDVTALLYPPTE